MGKVLRYLLLAATAMVGLYSAYEINNVADVIDKSNTDIKRHRAERENKLEQKLDELQEEVESADYAVAEPVIDDHWGDDVAE